jgi:TM2 domain-containing membrane protein YozV
MFCSHCGKENHGQAAFCSGCGAKLAGADGPRAQMPAPASAPPGMSVPAAPGELSEKSKLAAALLAFFLGSLGIHRFYLGYTTIGIIQLAITLCTCGLGGLLVGLWALIEMVFILTGSLKDAQGRTLRD